MPHGPWSKRTIISLVLHGKAGGQDVVNLHHFEIVAAVDVGTLTDGLAQDEANALREDWITNCKTAWLALHHTSYTLNDVGAQVVERNGQTNHKLGEQLHHLSSANTGTAGGGGGSEPLATALVLRWRSLVSTRHARGRTYVGPLAGTQVIGSPPNWDVVNYGAVPQAYVDVMINRYAQGGSHLYGNVDFTIYNRPYDAPQGAYVKRVGGVLTVVNNTTNYDGDSNHILSGSYDTVLRSQRRREIGVGS